ncbi:MAG TPA: regulator, partial [Halomonas sp.]|nr:regulator [Halomonas sp.]HBS16365.1 regulator [Halomonas sp.]
RALKLKRRDRIHYTVRPDGEVVLTRASDEAKPDPVMVNFLNFLERDLLAHPENIRPVTASSFAEAERLTAGIEVDLEEALEEDDDDE